MITQEEKEAWEAWKKGLGEEGLSEENAKLKARIEALEGVVADLRSDELIKEFSELSGAIQVHQAWRDGMLYKGRDVDASKMVFDKLKKDDKILDAYIAYEVIKDFCDYILTHPHERLEGV